MEQLDYASQLEPATQSGSPHAKGEMTLIGHLEELRNRVIKVLAALGIGSIVCYAHIERILSWLIVPAGKLYYLNPAEAFFTYCKVVLVGGFLLAIPIIMYQFWAFLLPAFTERELSAGLLLIPCSILLFYSGFAFAYFFVVPSAVQFFLGFSTESLQPMLSLGQYVGFILSILFPFGLVFELPLLLLALIYFDLITSSTLANYRKYAIVGSFIIGGVVSPTPDIFGQAMLALPILLLYEISYYIAKYFHPKKRRI